MTLPAKTTGRGTTAADTYQVMSREECEALGRKILDMAGGTPAGVGLFHQIDTKSTLVRGDMHLSTERTRMIVSLMAGKDGHIGRGRMNQTDDASLRALVDDVLAAGRSRRGSPGEDPGFLGPQQYAKPAQLRFDSTVAAMGGDARADACHRILSTFDRQGLVGGGNVSAKLIANGFMDTDGLFGYFQKTESDISVVARTKDRKGSGWAWSGYEDWARNDIAAIATRAADLGVRSANPVAVEPGRYTVILEPSAVALLANWLIGVAQYAERGDTPWSKIPSPGTKLDLQMLDQRLSVVTDLWDPEMPLPTVSSMYGGYAASNRTWYERGVLANLIMGAGYAKAHGRPAERVIRPEGIRVVGQGPTQTLEEMIASTKRGIWVNRIGFGGQMNERTALITGTTRDGTFLIENGKITKAIKNLRFTESVFFALNKVEAIGEPVRASNDTVAPRLKVRDFEFTSLTDAV